MHAGTAELRYADCPTTEAELLIDALPAIVKALVYDIQTAAEFSSEFRGGQWLDGARPEWAANSEFWRQAVCPFFLVRSGQSPIAC